MNSREHHEMRWGTRLDNEEDGYMFTPRRSKRYPWIPNEQNNGWIPFALATPSDYYVGGMERLEIVFDDGEDEPVRKIAHWDLIRCEFVDDITEPKPEVYPQPLAWRFAYRGARTAKPASITDVKTYNDKVVVVFWADGTQTKSVCSDNDKFDYDTGVTICILKKFLEFHSGEAGSGTKRYNNMMRAVHRLSDIQKERDEFRARLMAKSKEADEKRRAKAAKRRKKRIEEAAKIFADINLKMGAEYLNSEQYFNDFTRTMDRTEEWIKNKEAEEAKDE